VFRKSEYFAFIFTMITGFFGHGVCLISPYSLLTLISLCFTLAHYYWEY